MKYLHKRRRLWKRINGELAKMKITFKWKKGYKKQNGMNAPHNTSQFLIKNYNRMRLVERNRKEDDEEDVVECGSMLEERERKEETSVGI